MEESVQKEYFELLKFESVGADPAKLRDSAQCALWLKKWLEGIGFTGELLLPEVKDGKAAPPILFAERKGDEGAPTALVYGHYDVQPADPLGEWKTPPFEPTVVGERVYCRGAQDDKGQAFAFLNGVKDYLNARTDAGSSRGLNLKVILEGQEESGSAALIALAPTLRAKLAADVLLVCDTSAAADLRPAIVAGLRGVAHFTVRLTGPNRDLHSGEYGGIAPNPAQAIAELVASLHNPDGSIAVVGFRDGIEPPSEAERRAAEAAALSEEAYYNDIGCEPVGGQQGKTVTQRNSFEPTIEVNGIHSGYGGAGAKTVIPAEAFAKLSMRLVASGGQVPARHEADGRGRERGRGRLPPAARLADLPAGVGRAGRDGSARRGVPVGRRVDSGRVGPARGVGRGAAHRRLGPGGRSHPQPERKLLLRAVREGARVGGQDPLRARAVGRVGRNMI